MTAWALLLIAVVCVGTTSAVPALGSSPTVDAASQLNPEVFYAISNNVPGYEGTRQSFRGEWFDVYSAPIHIRHASVFWQIMDPVPLPDHIVARYAREGSAPMAVTGWEVDVVRKTPSGRDESIPCYQLYNHHHTVYLMGEHARRFPLNSTGVHGQFKFVADNGFPSGQQRYAGAPIVQAFNQNNGNEHRQSFHGLPQQVVQPIARPASMLLHPMILNVANPADPKNPLGGPIPKSVEALQRENEGTFFTDLAECPCTTRIQRSAPDRNHSHGMLDGRPFVKDCRQRPLTTISEERNPSCFVETYSGGLMCCQDGTVLLDSDQKQADFVEEIFYKLRFYFKDYEPTIDVPAFHMEWSLTGGVAGEIPGNPRQCKRIEYEVPAAPRGTPPEKAVHEISSEWTLRDLLHPCDHVTDPYCADPRLAEERGLMLVAAGTHCHSPGCLESELRNAETGELICHIKAKHGASDRAKDELGYIWMPPCLWGWKDKSLREPPLLRLNTRLNSTIRYNATTKQIGVMALWQMRAIYPQVAESAGLVVIRASSQALPQLRNPVALPVRLMAAPALLVAAIGLAWAGARYRRTRQTQQTYDEVEAP